MAQRRTKKFTDFVNDEYMEGKAVRRVPGIGPVINRELSRMGIKKAEQLFRRFISKNSTGAFINWMLDKTSARDYDASECANAFSVWAAQFYVC